MISGALIMAGVAMLCTAAAIALFRRPTPTDASVYRNRIAATMLLAAGIMLAVYARTLHHWDAAA
jgi:multisubunit Na+/H+ antiporter MnhG subunit